MKYFVDFEATQFSHEIISIGCVNEKGEKFYSLVKPGKMSNMTSFIVKLTGITKEMLKKEKSANEVFSNFFDWIKKDDDFIEFYCYGNADKDFLKHTLNTGNLKFKAQSALSLLITNLKDYSVNVKKYFDLSQCVSLEKVSKYFFPEENIIFHDALTDARMLQRVYTLIEKGEKVIGIPFPNHMVKFSFHQESDFKFHNITIKNENEEILFQNLDEASTFIISKIKNIHKNVFPNKQKINKRIIKAINLNEKYFEYEWSIKLKE